jgi:hypothetical protein
MLILGLSCNRIFARAALNYKDRIFTDSPPFVPMALTKFGEKNQFFFIGYFPSCGGRRGTMARKISLMVGAIQFFKSCEQGGGDTGNQEFPCGIPP